jgi:transcriptional regulator with XRE-family HTH domain
MNETIVKKIKDARIERGLTQKDLADHLDKTAAAISDLERGKVQVSASDLYKIAELLNKPIEYFYGEDLGGKDIEDMVAIMQKQPPEERSKSMMLTNLLLQVQGFEDEANKFPEGKAYPIERAKEFYNLVVPLSVFINDWANKINELRNQFDNEFKAKGIDISK